MFLCGNCGNFSVGALRFQLGIFRQKTFLDTKKTHGFDRLCSFHLRPDRQVKYLVIFLHIP